MKNSYIRFLIISFLSVVAFPLVVLILHTYALFFLFEALVRVHHSLSIFSNNLIFSLLLLLLFSFLTHREYSLWLPFKQPPHHFAGERANITFGGRKLMCAPGMMILWKAQQAWALSTWSPLVEGAPLGVSSTQLHEPPGLYPRVWFILLRLLWVSQAKSYLVSERK